MVAAYKDGSTFTTYCDKLYERHNYKLVAKDGQSTIIDDYGLLRALWYHYREILDHVEIVDAPQKKGFG